MTFNNKVLTEMRPSSGYVFKKVDSVTDDLGNSALTVTYARSLFGAAISNDWIEVPVLEYEIWLEQQPNLEMEQINGEQSAPELATVTPEMFETTIDVLEGGKT